METERRWYTEPETFIAVAALIVSVSAVAVGIYEASLQRHHDRAEVWPRLEISTFTSTTGDFVELGNSGIGPAIVENAVVTLDGKPQHSWADILHALDGVEPQGLSNATVAGHGLRPGDQIKMVSIPVSAQPHDFWKAIARVGIALCYRSVFDQYWIVESKRLGEGSTWSDVDHCAPQDTSANF
jgi:hypothetical protein